MKGNTMKLIKTTIFMTTALLCASHAHAAAAGAGAMAEEAVPAGAVVINSIADWEGFVAGWRANHAKPIALTTDLTLTDGIKHNIPYFPPFKGSFHGGNHVITIDRTGDGPTSFAGLFKEVDSAATPSIRNFTLNFGSFSDATHAGNLGALLCTLKNGQVHNVKVQGGSIHGGGATGGVCGVSLGGEIKVFAPEFSGTISGGPAHVASFIGYLGTGSIAETMPEAVTDNPVSGSRSDNATHAGIMPEALTTNNFVSGSILGNTTYSTVGGLVGYMPADAYVGGYVGGLVGHMSAAPEAEHAPAVSLGGLIGYLPPAAATAPAAAPESKGPDA
jgi:hypothetical protein